MLRHEVISYSKCQNSIITESLCVYLAKGDQRREGEGMGPASHHRWCPWVCGVVAHPLQSGRRQRKRVLKDRFNPMLSPLMRQGQAHLLCGKVEVWQKVMYARKISPYGAKDWLTGSAVCNRFHEEGEEVDLGYVPNRSSQSSPRACMYAVNRVSAWRLFLTVS